MLSLICLRITEIMSDIEHYRDNNIYYMNVIAP